MSATHPTTATTRRTAAAAASPSPLLARTLRLNAVLTAATGAASLAGAGVLSEPLGIPVWLLASLGVGLLGYAALLWNGSRTVPVPTAFGRFAVAADTAWVVGVVAILLAWPEAMTPAGRWTLGLLTLVVADLAIAQAIGLRRQGRA